MNLIIFLPILASFLITLFLMPSWIKRAKQIGLLWADMHKISKENIAGSGGIVTILGFIIGVLLFAAYRVFYVQTTDYLIEIFAITTSILFLSSIGLVDDLLGWQKGGLSKKYRLIFIALAAIPLMAINAGKSTMAFPFLGVIDIGLFYPLILIPLGIVGATTTFNFLEGYNGLGAGQGVIILSGLAIVSHATGSSWLAIINLCLVASLLAFLHYNSVPARVFPGDVLTYSIGGLIAITAIIGNFEKIAVFFFIPYILETILKSRGKLEKQSFGVPNKDGTLSLAYKKFYGLEHIAIWLLPQLGFRSTEKNVVYLLRAFQIAIILIGFAIFREGIFL